MMPRTSFRMNSNFNSKLIPGPGGMSGRQACYIHAYTVYTPIGGKDVARDVTLRFTAHKQVSVQARKQPWL